MFTILHGTISLRQLAHNVGNGQSPENLLVYVALMDSFRRFQGQPSPSALLVRSMGEKILRWLLRGGSPKPINPHVFLGSRSIQIKPGDFLVTHPRKETKTLGLARMPTARFTAFSPLNAETENPRNLVVTGVCNWWSRAELNCRPTA